MKIKTKIKYRSITKKWLGIVGRFAITESGDIYFHPRDSAPKACRWLCYAGFDQWYVPRKVSLDDEESDAPGLHFDTESMQDIGKCMELYKESLK